MSDDSYKAISVANAVLSSLIDRWSIDGVGLVIVDIKLVVVTVFDEVVVVNTDKTVVVYVVTVFSIVFVICNVK